VPGSPQEATLKRPLVLVADDDVTSRLLASAALEGGGFSVVEANDGREALECFAHDRPQIVLLDIEMPELDGLAACERIRDVDPDVPILMLTGSSDLACIRSAFAAGATDFAMKPANWLILTQRCHFALKAARNLAGLRSAEEQARAAHRLARLGTWQVDVGARRLTGSQEFFRLLAFPAGTREIGFEELIARLPEADRTRVGSEAAQTLSEGRPYRSDEKMALPGGQHLVARIFADPVLDEEGRLAWMSGIVQDVTAQVEAEEKIRFLSQYDSITGLAGRALLDDMLETAIRRGIEAGTSGAVLTIAFEGVRRIRETVSQQVGDAALQQMSARVLAWVRENASALFSAQSQLAPSVARLGGVELAVTLPEIDLPQRAAALARQLIDEVSHPIQGGELEVAPAPAVGIAVWPHDGREAESLVRNARMAMDHAGRQVDPRYRFFTGDMNEIAVQRLSLERELRRAIEENELRLHYQPKVLVETGRISGAEALIRWQHPRLGLRPPADFITLAEETGLILPIGEWVVREACRQQRLWRERGLPSISVSANLSPAQLCSDSIVAVVAEAVREGGGNPALFELEITETALLQDAEASARRLDELKSLDISLSLDDFGTGYSSLSYLKSFPVDTVKIDRSFVEGLGTVASDTAVTAAVVSLSRALGLRVVAEGVETEAQWKELRGLGCHEAQGYLFSRPIDPDAFEALLRATPSLGQETKTIASL
jgi:diguanylate cyclase (GGDEF)-like protein